MGEDETSGQEENPYRKGERGIPPFSIEADRGKAMTRRELMIDYGMRFMGKPYIWGGNGIIGFDCSGFAQECLASVKLDPKGDQTAEGLRTEFAKEKTDHPDLGSLVFFGKGKAAHVAIYIGDGLMMEAGGGGSSCTTPQEAAKVGAMVRVRAIANRTDLLGYADPFMRLG